MSSGRARLRTMIGVTLAVLISACLWLAPASAAARPGAFGPGASTGVSSTGVSAAGASPLLPTAASTPSTARQTPSEPSESDRAEDRLRFITIGLIVLAVLIAVVTALFWRATRPDRS